MSVQSEVSRLQNAKAAIKAAIEGKGVTVPDATLLDGMAALIESIEAGGSGGGGFDSNHVDIAYGSFVTAKAVRGVRVDCGFPISKDDAFMYVFGCIPIATRTRGANITGYFANKMPSASLPDTAYGGTFYSSITSTRLSPSGVVKLDNVFIDTTGNDIRIIGYGSWEFVPTNEYFWIVVKEKNA